MAAVSIRDRLALTVLCASSFFTMLASTPAASQEHAALEACARAFDAEEYARAVTRCDAALADPALDAGDRAAALRLRGMAHVWEAAPDQALEDLDAALQADPTDAGALTARAFALSYTDAGAALRELRRAFLMDPEPEALFAPPAELVEVVVSSTDENRIIFLTEILTQNPSVRSAYEARAALRLSLDQAEAATNDYDKAIELSPTRAELYIGRARSRLHVTPQSAPADPYDPAEDVGVGIRYTVLEEASREDVEAALADYGQAIRLDPQAAYFVERAETLLENDMLEPALADLDEAIRLAPKEAKHFQRKASILENFGRPYAAVDAITALIDADRSRADSFALRARMFEALEDRDAAIADYSSAISLSEGLDPAAASDWLTVRARLYAAGGATELALMDYAAAIERRAVNGEAVAGRGALLVETGKATEAVALYSTYLLLSPDDTEVLYLRGEARQSLGDHQAVIRDAARVIELRPGWADGHVLLGEARRCLGEPEAALSSYESAMSVKPSLVNAWQAALAELGHEPGPVDGVYGEATRQALRAYIAANASCGPAAQ